MQLNLQVFFERVRVWVWENEKKWCERGRELVQERCTKKNMAGRWQCVITSCYISKVSVKIYSPLRSILFNPWQLTVIGSILSHDFDILIWWMIRFDWQTGNSNSCISSYWPSNQSPAYSTGVYKQRLSTCKGTSTTMLREWAIDDAIGFFVEKTMPNNAMHDNIMHGILLWRASRAPIGVWRRDGRLTNTKYNYCLILPRSTSVLLETEALPKEMLRSTICRCTTVAVES